MNVAIATEWVRQLMWTAITAGAPVIMTVAIIGLVLAVLQAATQINDAAVPFTAKAIGVCVVLVVAGSWMMGQMTDFASRAFVAIGTITGG